MGTLRYKRALLKLSGESLQDPGGSGLGMGRIREIGREIVRARELGAELGLVIGGGNLIRGRMLRGEGIEGGTADHMGMLATVINALALQGILEGMGLDTRVMSAIRMDTVAEPYIRRRAIRHIEKGRVVIMAGGTGNPNFTTDTAAALRAVEIGAEVLLKATQVDGVYSDDPVVNPEAEFFARVSYREVLSRNLKVMDATATALCMDNALPIVVFGLDRPSNVVRVLRGERVGTLVEKE
jgi:uridylate kinase